MTKNYLLRFGKLLLLVACMFLSNGLWAQFRGASGAYFLGTADIPNPLACYADTNTSGAVVRFTWKNIEPNPDSFRWSYVDSEIAKAVTYSKKISLQPLGVPTWMDSIGATRYYYIDKNTAHTTYGRIVSQTLPWDTTYIRRYKNFMQHLAAKYATDTTVVYINAVGGFSSRGLPDTVITDTARLTKQPFWTAFPYNADTFAVVINALTDHYMGLFPNTPLWCSVDYVPFELQASGRTVNYLATQYTAYGLGHYPDRFGLFREDIAGCNPPPTVASGNQWYIMQQNPCHTGAQMLWSVQDGPLRMNRCGITPNTKQAVLDSAVNRAISLGMRYLEVYAADIFDGTLTASIAMANRKFVTAVEGCTPTTGVVSLSGANDHPIYPNPTTGKLHFGGNGQDLQNSHVLVCNTLGVVVADILLDINLTADLTELGPGLYYLQSPKNLFAKQLILIQY